MIGKYTVGAIKSSPAPIKTISGLITMGGLGGIYFGTKYLNQLEDREHTLSTGAVALALRNLSYGSSSVKQVILSSEDKKIIVKNITTNKEQSLQEENLPDKDINPFINSSNEEFTVFDSIYSMLMCIEVLNLLALFGIIICGIIIYINKKSSNLQDKYQSTKLKWIIQYFKLSSYTTFT